MTATTSAVGTVLEADHHRIDAHFANFARALAEDTVDAVSFANAGAALRHHIYVEESLHFPPLRRAGLLAPVLVMLREHGEIWRLLDALDEAIGSGTSAADLVADWQVLERALADHNVREENILYPAADRILPLDVAEEVLDGLSSGRTPEGWVCEMAR